MIRSWRRTIQISVIFLILGISLLSYYARLLAMLPSEFFGKMYEHGDTITAAMTEAQKLICWPLIWPLDKLAASIFPSEEALHQAILLFKGAPWSISLFGYDISDPLAVLGYVLASWDFYLPFILSALIPILLVLIMGKVFCSWICPAGFILELLDEARHTWRSRYPKLVISPKAKYVVLIITLALSLGKIMVLPYFLPYVVLGREIFVTIYYGVIGLGWFLLLFILIWDGFFVRGWCRYLCPAGAFLGLLGKYRLFRVVWQPSRCQKSCGRCLQSCPMVLRPGETQTIECINCGNCIDACPNGALAYGWKALPNPLNAPPQREIHKA